MWTVFLYPIKNAATKFSHFERTILNNQENLGEVTPDLDVSQLLLCDDKFPADKKNQELHFL